MITASPIPTTPAGDRPLPPLATFFPEQAYSWAALIPQQAAPLFEGLAGIAAGVAALGQALEANVAQQRTVAETLGAMLETLSRATLHDQEARALLVDIHESSQRLGLYDRGLVTWESKLAGFLAKGGRP